jgi:hypothetical protein
MSGLYPSPTTSNPSEKTLRVPRHVDPGGSSCAFDRRAGGHSARGRRSAARIGRPLLFRWARLARRHPSWFGPDHVHVTASAYNTRAREMARTIRRCREQALR